MAISKRNIYDLAYGNEAKEYSFSGSLGAEKKMWDKFFKAIDNNDAQTAANVFRTLEEENWHTMTSTMVDLIDKPASERGTYFDHAEKWTPKDEHKALQKMAHKYGEKTASEKNPTPTLTRSEAARARFDAARLSSNNPSRFAAGAAGKKLSSNIKANANG